MEVYSGQTEILDEVRAALRARLFYNDSRLKVRAIEARNLKGKNKNRIVTREVEVEVKVEEQDIATIALLSQAEKEPKIKKNSEILRFFLKVLDRIKQSPASDIELLQNRNNLTALYFHLLALCNGKPYEESKEFLQHKKGAYWRDITQLLDPFFVEMPHLVSCLRKSVQGDGYELIFSYDPATKWEPRMKEMEKEMSNIGKKKKKKSDPLYALRAQCREGILSLSSKVRKFLKKFKTGKSRFKEAFNKPGDLLFKKVDEPLRQIVIPSMRELESPVIEEKYASLKRALQELKKAIAAIAAKELTGEEVEKSGGNSRLVGKPEKAQASNFTPEQKQNSEEMVKNAGENKESDEDLSEVLAWRKDPLPLWLQQLAREEVSSIETIIDGMRTTFDPENKGVWDIKGGDIRFSLPGGKPVHLYFHYPYGENPCYPAWKFNFMATLDSIRCP